MKYLPQDDGEEYKVRPLMKQNTKERKKIEAVGKTLLHAGVGDGQAVFRTTDEQRSLQGNEIRGPKQHRMQGVGRVYESLIDNMVANSKQESNIDPAIMRQYSTIGSKSGQKSENAQILERLTHSAADESAEQQRR